MACTCDDLAQGVGGEQPDFWRGKHTRMSEMQRGVAGDILRSKFGWQLSYL